MFNFESALLKGRSEIPLPDAASFLLGMRTPVVTKLAESHVLQKTAGLLDAPDEAGTLEGQFTVPVETVSALIGVVLSKIFAVMNASMLYANMLRGPLVPFIRSAMSCRDYEYRSMIEYLTSRANVLAGAVHVAEIEPPPPITDPISAAHSVIRGNQEIIQGLQSLCSVMGNNPMKDRIASYMSGTQSSIDDMWRALDPDSQPATVPGAVGVPVAAGVPTAPEEPVEQEVVASTKEASGISKVASMMAKWAKENPTDADLKETGRQRAVANISAEHEREKSRRGERAGRSLGALGGLAAGGALGKRLIGGKAGTIAGAAMGGLAGRAAGGELGTELDIHRGKTASATPTPQGLALLGAGALIGSGIGMASSFEQGKRTGESEHPIARAAGAILGGALGGAVGLNAGDLLGKGSAGGRLAGTITGSMSGASLGGNFGNWAAGGKTASSVKTAAARMVAWVKVAQDMPSDMAAPMSAPTDQPELEPLNYMQAEQIGRKQQEQSEAIFYKRRASSIQQQAAMAVQQAQQEAQMATQQAQQVIEQAQTADAKVQQALGEAMSAKDEALRQAETAARIRMGQQDLRLKLMELASTEPDMQAAMSLAETTGPPPEPPPMVDAPPPPMTADAAKETDQAARAQGEAEQQTAQAAMKQASAGFPDAGLYPPAGLSGPAGKSATPRTAPGSAPIAGGDDMNANSGGAPGLNGQGAMPTTKLSSVRVKTAGPLGAGIGGLGGAMASGLSTASNQRAGTAPVIAQVQQLERSQDGSFGQAAALARARKTVIDRELQQSFPGRVLAGNVAQGAFRGAMGGSALENNLRYLTR